MHLNGNMLGLAVAPLPGFGILGKVPTRFAHLVELKKSVREKAWAHWLAAPGLVTHNTSHKNKQGPSSSSNGASKSKIRLTAGTSDKLVSSRTTEGSVKVSAADAVAEGTTLSGDAVSTTEENINPANQSSQPTATNTTQYTEMDTMEVSPPIDAVADQIIKRKTQFSLHKPIKKLCQRTPVEQGYFLTDTYIEG